MNPLFMGLAVAEFLPVDPPIWFDTALAASLQFSRYGSKIEHDPNAGDEYVRNFLIGWLHGTPGGCEALATWMKNRGIKNVTLLTPSS